MHMDSAIERVKFLNAGSCQSPIHDLQDAAGYIKRQIIGVSILSPCFQIRC